MRSAVRHLAALAFLVIASLLLALPANVGSVVSTELRSGERVHWEPATLVTLVRTLRGEVANAPEAAELAQVVHSESQRVGMDPLYVLALMKVESDFRADAVSSRGAVGLLQVRPLTARSVHAEAFAGVSELGETPRLRDPRTNVALGIRYLRRLEREFPDSATALAAYNMGPTRVREQLAKRRPIPSEYARRVKAAYRAFRDLADG